jgi:hypothetical protein
VTSTRGEQADSDDQQKSEREADEPPRRHVVTEHAPYLALNHIKKRAMQIVPVRRELPDAKLRPV